MIDLKALVGEGVKGNPVRLGIDFFSSSCNHHHRATADPPTHLHPPSGAIQVQRVVENSLVPLQRAMDKNPNNTPEVCGPPWAGYDSQRYQLYISNRAMTPIAYRLRKPTLPTLHFQHYHSIHNQTTLAANHHHPPPPVSAHLQPACRPA